MYKQPVCMLDLCHVSDHQRLRVEFMEVLLVPLPLPSFLDRWQMHFYRAIKGRKEEAFLPAPPACPSSFLERTCTSSATFFHRVIYLTEDEHFIPKEVL